MEITCNDSVQCLVLFDKGTDIAKVARLFGMMPNIEAHDPDAAKAPQTILCGRDLRELLGSIYEDQSLKNIHIALPHASNSGHKDILRKVFHPRFAELEVDGVYNEKHYNSLGQSTLNIIYGNVSEWGYRRRGIVTTGDNRKASFDDLGANSCWMRLGEPTAEVIRQAVLADEARICYEEPTIPSQRVLELRVNSTLTGADFELVFNDGFNALIGGRGSGKSSILEYLRFVLGRSTLDSTEDETANRERDLISGTLVGGYVEADLDRNGVIETWRRSLDKQSIITVTTNSETRELPINAAQERFRARAFSQKQLSTMVRHHETADEQITGIAAAESVDRRRHAEQEIDDAERAVRAAFQQVIQGWAAKAAFDRAEAAAADLTRRLGAMASRLESGGASPEQQAILNNQPRYNRTAAAFVSAKKAFRMVLAQLEQIKEISVDDWTDLAPLEPVSTARMLIENFNSNLNSIIRSTIELLEQLASDVTDREGEFEKYREKFSQDYLMASAAQSHLANLLAELKILSEQQQMAATNLQEARSAQAGFAGAEKRLAEARGTLTSRIVTLRGILNEAADKIILMSDGVLRAHVEEESVPDRFIDAIADLCERCGIRNADNRCRELAEDAAKDGRKGWEEIVQRLLGIRKGRVQRGDAVDVDPNDIKEIRSALPFLTENQARLVLARLDDDRLGKFLAAWASPFIRFEYKDRGSYMSFERASPGQQAAALLTLLLNQEAGTLIIDQPEDDLDNRIIMNIAKTLQITKRNRQLIFATHNPNFVVNGDADKVVVLAPSVEPNASEASQAAQIAIDEDGAIETPAVRKSITETMEGGLSAFELRGRKYAIV